MVCVIAMVALLAAILLPRVPRGTSRPRLEAYAVEVASLLKADRTAAMRDRRPVAAQVDAAPNGGSLRHRAAASVRLPDDVAFEALLPERCDGRPALSTISFFANGMSCGGVIRLIAVRQRLRRAGQLADGRNRHCRARCVVNGGPRAASP